MRVNSGRITSRVRRMNRVKQPGRDLPWQVNLQAMTACILMLFALLSGCARLRLPAIDPTGNSIFLPRPYSTGLCNQNSQSFNPLRENAVVQPPPVVSFPQTGVPYQLSQHPVQMVRQQPELVSSLPRSRYPIEPAFKHPADPPACDATPQNHCGKKHVIPHPQEPKSNAARGQIITTPARIIAPVGSEVVVLAGICGPDGRFAINQPLEFMLSNDSVGQFIEIGGMQHKAFNQLIGPSARKFDGQYAWGRTGMKELLLTRGTPTPLDDITQLKGQTFVSLSSASPGTSYLTTVAPNATGWDKRRSSTLIHWVDGNWSIPVPTIATSGTVHAMTTRVTSATGDGGVADWRVRYSIVGGAPAEFAPAGSQSVEAITGPDGMATAQLRQPAGQFDPGTTQIRVDVIRPKQYGESELVVESSITSVTWSAPALTLRAIGPRSATANMPFNYRIEVTNPGDQVSRGVVVSTRDLNGDVEFISSTPKPTEYGNQFQWDLGDIPPGSPPVVIDIQMKSQKQGNAALCFDVASLSDGLQTEACAQTEIGALCIGLDVDGPTTAVVGERLDFVLRVSNQCNESLRKLVLDVTFDPGLEVPGEGRRLTNSIASLAYGQTEEVELSFVARQPGRHCFYLNIADEDNNNNQSKICVTIAPAASGQGAGGEGAQLPSPIELRVTGDSEIQDNGTGDITVAIRNISDRPVGEVILTNRFAPSLNPIEVSREYPQSWLGSDLVFVVGQLEPGEQALVKVRFEAMQPDANAFSEFTVSSKSNENISATERFDINIVPASGAGEPGIGIPSDTGQGGQLPRGAQPPPGQAQPPGGQPTQPRNPTGEPGIGIPPDNSQSSLRIDVRATPKTVRVGEQATVEFTVANNSTTTDVAIDITMLIPPSLKLVGGDNSRFGLDLRSTSPDSTQYDFETRNQMRPGEAITFVAAVEAVQVGTSTFEVQGKSRNTVGTTTGADVIFVGE